MSPEQVPPPDSLQIRCARLGHQIPFSYCRGENLGLPCPRIFLCWHPYFAVETYLRQELTAEQWRDAFEQPGKSKLQTLAELIEQARKK